MAPRGRQHETTLDAVIDAPAAITDGSQRPMTNGITSCVEINPRAPIVPHVPSGVEQASNDMHVRVDELAAGVADQVVAWRHDIHQHRELSNREVRSAGLVADHLRSLGLDEVRTDIAGFGVVGVLRGKRGEA